MLGRSHEITLIPGDGIGPEIATSVTPILEAALRTHGSTVAWDVQEAGEAVFHSEGTALPERILDSIRRTKVALKGPIGTPIGSSDIYDVSSVNVALRREFDLFACVRPCKAYSGVPSRFPETDLVIVRENLEDLYSGIEAPVGSWGAALLAELVNGRALPPSTRGWGGVEVPADSAFALKAISASESRRVAHYAFAYAQRHGYDKVTVAHKANILKETDGLFLRTATEVGDGYLDITCESRIVDNLCQQLVLFPERFGVILLPNLYGDIASDLCAGLVGGLGVAPGANIGPDHAIFEATHGSAPDIAGQGIANPIALLLSGAMMLRHLGEVGAAQSVEGAVRWVLAKGDALPADLCRGGQCPAGTQEVADAILERLTRQWQ
jgi:isocitrate dehydrogenase (NAD+)